MLDAPVQMKTKSLLSMLRRLLKRRRLVAGCVTAALGGLAACELYSGVVPRNFFQPLQCESSASHPTFILLSASQSDHYTSDDTLSRKWWLRWKRTPVRLHWWLLKLAQSKDRKVRHLAIKTLVELPGLAEPEYGELAQACDLITSVGFARTPGSNLKLFLPPPPLPLEHIKCNTECYFRIFLASLPQSDINPCVEYFTRNAMRTWHSNIEDICGGEWCFGGEGLASEDSHLYGWRRPRQVALETVERFCLQALLSHSTVASHRPAIVKQGGLQLMWRIYKRRKEDPEILSLVGKILGNLAVDGSLHKQIFMAGWLGTLTSWSRSNDITVSLPAARALANMDRDQVTPASYEDGVYLCHPLYRELEGSINADLVFVHGLLGGAFRTWRQRGKLLPMSKETRNQDTQRHSGIGLTPEMSADSSSYTYCWPKDWLAQDCPHLRVLAVDYDSHLTEWRTKCPIEKERRSLMVRSHEMLQKLLLAGVGKRPVVWVAHSMGGLLVKQMLVTAEQSDDPALKNLVANTAGIVFYSVPHKGSSAAEINSSMDLLFASTTELKEMRKDSPKLLELHKNFIQLARKERVPCLSFAETLKTKMGLNWSAQLVPLDSADPGLGEFYPVDVNHLNICKPESRASVLYRRTVDFIQKNISRTTATRFPGAVQNFETLCLMGIFQ